jgi:hypothetical protein
MTALTTPVSPFRDREILSRILVPYHEHCRYLLDGSVDVLDREAEFIVEAHGHFSIPRSCYIASTGHFNAVEFNICFNQLSYFMLGICAKYSLLRVFDGWSLEEFSRRQLSDFLIVKFSSSFRKSMNADSIDGQVGITRVMQRGASVFMKLRSSFQDGRGGEADGEALIVITG